MTFKAATMCENMFQFRFFSAQFLLYFILLFFYSILVYLFVCFAFTPPQTNPGINESKTFVATCLASIKFTLTQKTPTERTNPHNNPTQQNHHIFSQISQTTYESVCYTRARTKRLQLSANNLQYFTTQQEQNSFAGPAEVAK